MSGLLACPFCRELFSADEGPTCEDCGVRLMPLEDLPPSLDAQALEAEERGVTPTPAVDFPLPWSFAGRGRLALVLLAAAGLALFFAPWVWVVLPDNRVLSGFDLARGRAGWLWGGFVGWLTLLALVISRRTVNQMRGVRVICAVFASMTAVETLMMIFRPPQSHPKLTVQLEWQWGLHASLLVSLVAVGVSLFFGGRGDDLRDLPLPGNAKHIDEALH
ncbi:MAG: hypothetical protein KIT72_06360 [Polyangiaceae bacterium]|nr:hypothetical protein [Polyangiaceae bacterium]MCW5790024.1 hypothetical protein [Polyangiaceae bacterium]